MDGRKRNGEQKMNLSSFIEKYGDELNFDFNADTERKICSDLGIEYIEPKPKTVWKLEKGDIYWKLSSDGCTETYRWNGVGGDKRNRSLGNIFLTEEEAEAEKERREVEALLLKYGGRREWRKTGDNYAFVYTGGDPIISYIGKPWGGTIYFNTSDEADEVRKRIGKDRLVKALFRTEDEE